MPLLRGKSTYPTGSDFPNHFLSLAVKQSASTLLTS
jgi:hypothetical protein